MAVPAKTQEPRTRLELVHSKEKEVDSSVDHLSPDELQSSPKEQRPREEQSTGRASRAPRREELNGVASLLEREDAELVALARAGQPHAFEALYRRHSSYALALAVRIQGGTLDVEDVVHDAFLKAHDRLDDLREGASFRPWLSSVVVSLVRTRMRRRRMLGVLGLATAEPIDLDALVTPDAGPEVRAQLAQVYAVLREVAVDSRICWTLRYVEGRKLEDVAQLAKCSLATAKRRIAAVQNEILLSDLRGVSALQGPVDEATPQVDGESAAVGNDDE